MNKKMRELLARMQAVREAVKGHLEGSDTEKAQAGMRELEDLQAQYEMHEKLFKDEQAEIPEPEKQKDSGITADEKAFIDFCRGTNKALSFSANGAIVPKTVADKIIETVKELSPIFSKATIYYAKGTLSIPVFGLDGGDQIEAGYATEFTDLTAHAGKFTSVDLSALAIGALTKISKNLINNTDMDVLAFVVRRIAQAVAEFLEAELLVGTGAAGHMTGATKTTNLVLAGGATTAFVTAEKLIDMQLTVPQQFQGNAEWIFTKDVFKAVRKLKDGAGEFILIKDFQAGSGWTLLGKPIYISENMPAVAENAVCVLYGDFSGMALKMSKNVEIQVLNELYAAQGAVGVVAWVEADSKIENAQKFVGLKMAAA
jgi:HK97 family phage major capsid protein